MTRTWRKRETQSTGRAILVVDDQDEILVSTRLLLEREGHPVLTAAGGADALALFHGHHDLSPIIIDYFMPDMNGEQLVTEIRKLNADVQILLQTGYAGERPPRAMLKALMDIEHEPWAGAMHRFLRQTRHAANPAQGFAFHESHPPLGAGLPTRRGHIRRRTRHNLLLRLRDHKEATLRFLHDPTVPFTNTQAERDPRMLKVRQKISEGFRSDTGAQTFVTLRTVLSTVRKQGWNILATLTTPPAILTQN